MKILVVEDEVKLANAIRRALELQKYTAEVTFDGETGLDLALKGQYDLVILDVMLPHLDGISVCRHLREEKNNTPVLMLTAKGLVSDKVTGLDAGADDYMVKPFSFEELFSRIRALVRRSAKNTEEVLRAKDLTLNSSRFQVKRANTLIELSSKEFTLLEYLLRHKNKVFSKEQIINQVWNYDADILPSTIEVHIKNLRDKIDKPFAEPLIHTVRGFGYQLKDET